MTNERVTDEKAEELLGGSINPKTVRFKDIESRAPAIDRIMRDQAYLPGTAKLAEFVHGVVDFRPQNAIAFFQYKHEFDRHPEEAIHSSAMKLLSGKGSHSDHPAVQKLVHTSLQHMPELLHLYNSAPKQLRVV